MTPAYQTMITEGLKVVGEFLGKGAVDAAKGVIKALQDGVGGHTSPEVVLQDLKSWQDKVAANHVTEDADLHGKYSQK